MSEPPGTDDPGQRPEEQVGSVSEEAAKLFGAFSDWARDADGFPGTGPDAAPGAGPDAGPGGGLGEGLAALTDRLVRAVREVDEHLATGSAECTYCPICRAVHVVRRTSPEVRAHLATAASSLLQAAAGALATTTAHEGRDARREPGVEHIDLDVDDDHTAGDGHHDGARDTARPEEDDE